jgi:hypothetical protein
VGEVVEGEHWSELVLLWLGDRVMELLDPALQERPAQVSTVVVAFVKALLWGLLHLEITLKIPLPRFGGGGGCLNQILTYLAA